MNHLSKVRRKINCVIKSDIIKITLNLKQNKKIKVKNQKYRNIKTKSQKEKNLAF